MVSTSKIIAEVQKLHVAKVKGNRDIITDTKNKGVLYQKARKDRNETAFQEIIY